MYRFLMKMKLSNGSFAMHEDGECDMRAVYCAISVATLLNIITPDLITGTAEWIARQIYNIFIHNSNFSFSLRKFIESTRTNLLIDVFLVCVQLSNV
jgi:protein farnesyltransferase subunit beta